MTLPSVNLTETDGGLGVLPPSAGKLLAVLGPASAGPFNTPSTYARVRSLQTDFGNGPAVEAAATAIDRGKSVVIVRTEASTAGVAGAVDSTGKTGTSVITLTGTPVDDADLVFKAITGGTIGTAGIQFQWSLDGGRTMSPVTALGTATTFVVPGSGVTINFAAGTLIAGDVAKARFTAPNWSAAELATGLTALGSSLVSWELGEIAGPIDATAFDTIEARFAAMDAAGKRRAWIGHTRMPNIGETEAAYLTAMSTAFAAKATTRGALAYGAMKLVSAVSGRSYRRPVSYHYAAEEASVSEEINVADINRGPARGVSIRDINGNPDEHDEALSPGADDARFVTLRTIEGEQGVYVTRPRLFAPAGSDFQLMPHRRIMNITKDALEAYFRRRLNRPVLIDPATGFIAESAALEMEAGATAVMRAVLLAKPKASGVQFVLSRTDNLLSTKTLTGDARIIPFGYIEYISVGVGYTNPALALLAA